MVCCEFTLKLGINCSDVIVSSWEDTAPTVVDVGNLLALFIYNYADSLFI